MPQASVKPHVWRVNGKTYRTSATSMKVIEEAARKFANALKRLAER